MVRRSRRPCVCICALHAMANVGGAYACALHPACDVPHRPVYADGTCRRQHVHLPCMHTCMHTMSGAVADDGGGVRSLSAWRCRSWRTTRWRASTTRLRTSGWARCVALRAPVHAQSPRPPVLSHASASTRASLARADRRVDGPGRTRSAPLPSACPARGLRAASTTATGRPRARRRAGARYPRAVRLSLSCAALRPCAFLPLSPM